MRLDGRTAFITGGTQGVGAAIACALAGAGADLVLHGLNDDEAGRQTIETCRAAGVQVSALFHDLMQPIETSIPELFDKAISAASGIDLLVNNAGTFIDKPYLEMDAETYYRTMRLNVDAGYFLTQAFARRWIAAGIRGRVLFTGSINGMLAEPDHTAYDTSKGAVMMMVRSLCVSLAPHGIRVNSMAPGLVISPLTGRVLNKDRDVLEWMKLHTPNGQVPMPDVCGPAALFLLSNEAEHIHGQTLLVDGGMSIWQQPDLPDRFRKAHID
ncbi:MAG: SDR family oxidoreductase [Pirellulales bacterium]